MRTTCSRSYTKILPSPILPVRAAASTASMTRSTRSSATAASIFTLGRKSTTYSAPRYSSVWPFWRPNPFTSVTVMPCTPMAESASRTSSSLNGLMMAVTSFMVPSPVIGPASPAGVRVRSERVCDEGDQAVLAPVLPLVGPQRAVGVGALVVRAGVEAAPEVVRRAELPHRVREVAVVEVDRFLRALVALVAERAVQRHLFD